MRRRLAPKKSADPTLPHTSPVREGCWLSLLRSSRTNHVSLVKSPERRPWALKREGRPAAFAGRSESVLLGWDTGLAYRSEYPIPSAKRSVNLRSDRTGKDQGAVFFRTSSATKRTRYIQTADAFKMGFDHLAWGQPPARKRCRKSENGPSKRNQIRVPKLFNRLAAPLDQRARKSVL